MTKKSKPKAGPQAVRFMVSLFMDATGKPGVEIKGKPTLLELYTTLGAALVNVQAQITAELVAEALVAKMSWPTPEGMPVDSEKVPE